MNESTNKAIQICSKIKKPSEEHQKILNKLNPSCGTSSKANKLFNPSEASVAEKKKTKKRQPFIMEESYFNSCISGSPFTHYSERACSN